MTAPLNASRRPPYKLAGLALTVIVVAVLRLIFLQFQDRLSPKTTLILQAPRAGLVMDPGSKVTYNGVAIGRVSNVDVAEGGGRPQAQLILQVDPRYIPSIPANVEARINATTVFGNKYVSLTSPAAPVPQRVTADTVITATSTTTEFNTLFETIVSIAEKVDPVKLNQTLVATAQALSGLGTRFGETVIHANEILDDVNPRMPEVRGDLQKLGELADVYTDASPALWDFLTNAVTTARTFNEQELEVDTALIASIGVGNSGADVFERGGPYLTRGAQDLVPTAQLGDYYSPEILCTFRNFAEVAPRLQEILGGSNGYALRSAGTFFGAGGPYIYPDNLPRINARGGPEGKPGCWQKITHELWPAPYLVMDTGYSLAPYNHFELGSPLLIDYVWGRQVGEYTINP
jgi:phospholipid/cholesterol/gamma-HCH transport system substrate-binding protein